MFRRITSSFLLVLSAVLLSPAAMSQSLVVGIKEAPPFAMKAEDGRWEGISVALWEDIAAQQGLEFQWQEARSVEQLIDGLAESRLDLAVGALTATAARESRMDFSHPFYSTGLGIATRAAEGGMLSAVRALFSWQFLSAVSLLVAVLLLVGFAIWLLERQRNPEQFGGSTSRGIGNGFWWSAVTMTTVGYGDKAPVTAGGRILAVVWMFVSIITISGFTAAIASAATVGQLQAAVSGAEDLPKVRVATVGGSAAHDFLRAERIAPQTVDSLEAAMQALAREEVDAVVYDAPLLQFQLAQGDFPGIEVLPETISRDDYALGLRPGLELREGINQTMLEILQSPRWQQWLSTYLDG